MPNCKKEIFLPEFSIYIFISSLVAKRERATCACDDVQERNDGFKLLVVVGRKIAIDISNSIYIVFFYPIQIGWKNTVQKSSEKDTDKP